MVPTTLARSGRTVTLTPAARLQARRAVRRLGRRRHRSHRCGVRLRAGPVHDRRRGVARYDITRTLRPFRIDLDGNGFDDIFWYAGRCGRLDLVPRHRRPRRREHAGDRHLHAARRRLRRQRLRRRLPVRAGIGHRRDVVELAGIRSEVVPVLGVYVPLVGDFDRNGFDDIFWYGPGTGPDSAWYFGPTGRRGVAQSVTGSSYRPTRATSTVTGTTTSCVHARLRPRARGGAGPAGSPRARPCRSPGPTAPSRSTTTRRDSRRCSCTRPPGHLLEVRHVGLHVGAERTVASVGRPTRGGRLHGRCARRPARLRPRVAHRPALPGHIERGRRSCGLVAAGHFLRAGAGRRRVTSRLGSSV